MGTLCRGAPVPVKLRIPDAWEGRIHSEDVRNMLQGWFQRPYQLPADPGAGNARVSLNLPDRAVKVFEGLTGESPSVGLRRLIAAHIPALPASCYGRPIAAFREPRHADFASTGTQGSSLAVRPPVWDPATRRSIPAVTDEAEETMRFWFLIVVGGVALWALWKYARPSVSGALESAAVAKEMPRFAEWIPKGL